MSKNSSTQLEDPTAVALRTPTDLNHDGVKEIAGALGGDLGVVGEDDGGREHHPIGGVDQHRVPAGPRAGHIVGLAAAAGSAVCLSSGAQPR